MTNNTDGHAIWIVTLFSSEQWSGGILLTREAYARRKYTSEGDQSWLDS